MIYEDVELHNVAEIQPVNGGVRLQRVPENVRKRLNERAQAKVMRPANCEIRFVGDTDACHVTLSSEGETDVSVFHGTFDGREPYTVGQDPITIRVRPFDRFEGVDQPCWADQPFAPNVCRLVFGGRRCDPVILHDIKGKGIHPPCSKDLPGIKYLAYGTSITQGAGCAGPHLCYVAQTAWHLGADLINLGVAGSCHCETAFADYIAERTDWRIASLALSVNMPKRFSLGEFRKRVEYMVNTVAGADTSRPVACITLYPHSRDFDTGRPNPQYGGTPDEYRQALRDVATECPYPNVHLIEGQKLLTNIGGLTADLVHPSDNGMIEIGRNLAEEMKSLLHGTVSI